jgi:hypothetical protein
MAPIKEAGQCFFAEERQRLLKDAVERLALFARLWRMRRLRVATEKWKREGGDDGAGPLSAPKNDK